MNGEGGNVNNCNETSFQTLHFREKYEERKKNGGGKACDEIVLNIVLIKMLLNFQELPGSNKYEGVG